MHMYEAQKHNARSKKSDTEEYILHDTIQFKLKNGKPKVTTISDKKYTGYNWNV